MPAEATRRRRGGREDTTDAAVDAAGAVDGDAITLGLLDALHDNATVSQRSLSSELGIALGLTNAYVRRCIRRGFVKVSQAPANRYAYYLTPKGFAEKSRLTARFLTSSFSLYRRARAQYDELLALAAARNWRRLGLYGVGDLAEIAMLCALGQQIEIVGAVTPRPAPAQRFMQLPVVGSVAELGAIDGLLFAEFHRPEPAYQALIQSIASERILMPALIKVRTALIPASRPAGAK